MKMKRIILPLIALCVLGFSSCSKDESFSYSSTALQNMELMNVLKSKGFTFNQEGKLELNNIATSTISLDLSGTKLTDLTGLDILPNLKEVKLSNNGYGPIFDFTKLPAQITSVDLTGNDIYDFEGLVDVKVENEERKTTILHKLSKLYLPVTAKYNIEDLLPFYEAKEKDVDMQMADATGKMQPYNTIREIPDPAFHSYLKGLYPSMFIDDSHLDFSKHLTLAETGQNIMMFYGYEDIKSFEGIEYIINNPFLGSMSVLLGDLENITVTDAPLMPRENIRGLGISEIDFKGGVYLSKATSLGALSISHCSNLKVLDLSKTKICNQEIKDFDVMFSNVLDLHHCSHLEEIIFPNPGTDCMAGIILEDLPKLKKIDLSRITAIDYLYLFLDDTEVVYPQLKNYFSNGQRKKLELTTDREKVNISISQKIFETKAFRDFIRKYGKYCDDEYSSNQKFGAVSWLSLLEE